MDKEATERWANAVEETELSVDLRAAVGGLYRRFRGMRPEGALGDAAIDVLTHLHKHGPATLTELSDRARVSPASMSQTVNRLTSAGYAFRTRDPHDGRKVLFITTPEGDTIAGATHAHRTAWLDERLNALSDEDRAVLARAAELLRGIAES
ncbi:DNA-binding MarR family transcriptional regulator [Catenulispora sp. GP43]|uniref:MarR family winged helix-turn-helix transcriptional regulator n=1 Tax=Catenulispora sp. GP43 TaxID=3156263 RepID=UPI003515C87D